MKRVTTLKDYRTRADEAAQLARIMSLSDLLGELVQRASQQKEDRPVDGERLSSRLEVQAFQTLGPDWTSDQINAIASRPDVRRQKFTIHAAPEPETERLALFWRKAG